MSLNAKQVPQNGGKRLTPPLEAGAYPARLVTVTTLGIQEQRAFKGESKPPKLELMLGYELLDEFLKDEDGNDILEKPRWLSETITFSNLKSEKAKSTLRYYALDPDVKHDGDWGKLLNTPCILTVVPEAYRDKFNMERVKEKISAVSGMRAKEAAKAPPLVNEPRIFDFDSPNMEVYETFPDWIKEKLQKALNFKGSALDKMLRGETTSVKSESKIVQEPTLEEELEDEIKW